MCLSLTPSTLCLQLFAELKATQAVSVADLLPAVPDASVEGAAHETRAAWRTAGLQAVREGKLAVVLLAGALDLPVATVLQMELL